MESQWNQWQAVGWTFFVTFIIYGLTSSIWFYKRRHLYPIKARLPQFCLIHQIAFWFSVLTLSHWLTRDHGSCRWYHWMSLTANSLFTTPYVIRLFQLYFRYKITTEIMHREETALLSSTESPPTGWYTTRQHWISPNNLTLAFVVCLPSFIPLCWFFILAYPHITADLEFTDPTCPLLYSVKDNLFLVILMVLFFPLGAFVFLKVREVEEGLFIKMELVLVLAIGGTTVGLCYIPYLNTRHEVEIIVNFLAMYGFNTVTFVYPTYLTYKNHHQVNERQRPRLNSASISHISNSGTNSSIPRLQTYLQNKEQYMAFWKFLAKEFAVESLLFWNDVQILKKFLKTNGIGIQRSSTFIVSVNINSDGSCVPSSNSKSATVYHMIQQVLKTYILPGAPQTINISYENRNGVIESFKEISPQSVLTEEVIDRIFKTTVREIVDMLESDSYFRFVKSAFYLRPEDEFSAIDASGTTAGTREQAQSSSEQSHLVRSVSQCALSESKEHGDISSPSPILPTGKLQMELTSLTQENNNSN